MSFEKYSAGLANEIKNADFKNESELINFVRSKLHRLWNVKQSKIRKLEKQNKILKEALEFYANKNNWNWGNETSYDAEWKDSEVNHENMCSVGGKIARQALKKFYEISG